MGVSQDMRHVHLVGSVPLADAKAVFKTVSEELGALIPRIPDGETGVRTLWLIFQGDVIAKTANVAIVRQYDLAPGVVQRVFKIEDPAKPVVFGDLGYAREAIKSYRDFAALKAQGVIPAATRFLVSLPSPLAVVCSFFEVPSQAQAEAAYEKRLLEEVREIAAVVPAGELAIQWDVAVEIIIVEGWPGFSYFDTSKANMLERLVRIGDAIPSGVELGYHLCYGDPGHKHLVEPKDLGLCVEFCNTLTAKGHRPIAWIHMPVPRGRNDDAFFSPLKGLHTKPETEIVLGLVHYTDGVEGTRKRIETARRHLAQFGIATECGFGRRNPETVRDLLAIHKKVAAA